MLRRWIVLVAGVAAVGLFLTTPASGDPRDDKARVDRELAQASSTLEAATDRARAAAAALTDANRRMPGAEHELAEARGLLAAAQAASRQAAAEVDEAKLVLAAAARAHQQSTTRVEQARERVGRFVAATYRGRGLVAFTSILDAKAPSDVLDRMAYLDQVAADQKAALAAVVKARTVARQRQNEADEKKRDADEALATAIDLVERARAVEDQATFAAGRVQGLVNQRQQALGVAREERDKSLARYRDLQSESARIADELEALAARDRAGQGQRTRKRGPQKRRSVRDAPAPRSRGAHLIMPVRGFKTSDFGMRYDPYYHVWQLHAGLDIGAGGGTPIYAAESGTVTKASWRGGYGKYTCVYHGLHRGNGLATCYAHQSRINVFPGQRVGRGQLIGRVGTTGASTGNHLHFEVRLGGRPVNPVRWLPRCLC